MLEKERIGGGLTRGGGIRRSTTVHDSVIPQWSILLFHLCYLALPVYSRTVPQHAALRNTTRSTPPTTKETFLDSQENKIAPRKKRNPDSTPPNPPKKHCTSNDTTTPRHLVREAESRASPLPSKMRPRPAPVRLALAGVNIDLPFLPVLPAGPGHLRGWRGKPGAAVAALASTASGHFPASVV